MKRVLCAVVLLATAAAAGAQETGPWQLLGSADLALGQYYFNKSGGSLNGYSDLTLQEARSFSSASGFYLTEHSLYTGFKQVDELAGGGQLFQQSLDNSVGLKYIRRFEDGYSLKPRVGVRQQLFRETSDETWGNGLYDFYRYEAGVSWEHKTRLGLSIPWTYSYSYDLYYTHYPHFRSLSSQFGSALSAPNSGNHLLDTLTNQFTYRSDMDFAGFATGWATYSMALASFPEQQLVNADDVYMSSTRSDVYQSLNLGGSKRFADLQSLGRVRPTGSLGVTISNLFSNQNNFDTDPNHLKFEAGYFNYWEYHLTPSVSALFLGNLMAARISYDLAYRAYSGRLAQNPDGSYTGSPLRQLTHSVAGDVDYPLWKGLAVHARVLWSSSSANTHYDATYTYTYSSFNYFGGLEWRL